MKPSIHELRKDALAVLIRDHKRGWLYDGPTVRLENAVQRLIDAEAALEKRRARRAKAKR